MRRASAVLLAVLLLAAGTARAGDWPCWRGPTGQGHRDEKGLPLEWAAKTGKDVLGSGVLGEGDPFSTPAVPGGPIFIKGRSYIWCIAVKK